jgi:hemerythrin-like metal-binding protein
LEAEKMSRYIVWKDFYSVGDDAIDGQHKQIIELINDLYDAKENNADFAVVVPVLNQLVEYTINHFRDEEVVMLSHQYPEFVQHKALHDKMRNTTLALREHSTSLTGHDLLGFLKEWWVSHIQQEDKKYAPYLTSVVGV